MPSMAGLRNDRRTDPRQENRAKMTRGRLPPRSLFYGDVRVAGARSGNKIRFYRPISLKIFMQISKLGGSNGIGTTWRRILAKRFETGQAVRCTRTTAHNPTS